MATYYTKKCPHCGYAYSTHHMGKEVVYGSPIRKCVSCQKSFIDKDYVEIELNGVRNVDSKRISPQTKAIAVFGGFMVALALFLIVGAPKNDPPITAWACLIFCIAVPAFLIYVDLSSYSQRQKEIKQEAKLSKERLSDPLYAKALKELGYHVPDKYLNQKKKSSGTWDSDDDTTVQNIVQRGSFAESDSGSNKKGKTIEDGFWEKIKEKDVIIEKEYVAGLIKATIDTVNSESFSSEKGQIITDVDSLGSISALLAETTIIKEHFIKQAIRSNVLEFSNEDCSRMESILRSDSFKSMISLLENPTLINNRSYAYETLLNKSVFFSNNTTPIYWASLAAAHFMAFALINKKFGTFKEAEQLFKNDPDKFLPLAEKINGVAQNIQSQIDSLF